MSHYLRDLFRDRPFWMNALMVFCAYMTFVYVPWDFLWKPVAQDEEVWFGIQLTGWAAKAGEPFHWMVYAAGMYGFRRRRPWMCTWGSAYAAQVTLSMLVFPILHVGSLLGLAVGFISSLPFAALTVALWTSRDHFCAAREHMGERYGDWALVTGASSGLGEEFARVLANEGVSLVLCARRGELLRDLAAELEARQHIATRVVEADLSRAEDALRVVEAVADLEIAILINNAGAGYAGRFDKQESGRLTPMVRLHCEAPLILTSGLLPGMLERGRGAVIFTGSVAGVQPLPLHAVYSASKAFENLLGEALYVELRGTGVDVLSLLPGVTDTQFQEKAGELAHSGQSPSAVVEVALGALGQQPSVISGWLNWLRANLGLRLVSRPLVAHLAHDVMRKQTPADMR